MGGLAGLIIVAARASRAQPDAPPLSAAQLRKLLAFLAGPLGTDATLYAPYGSLLGWTADPGQDMAIIEVSTDNGAHSFVRDRTNSANLAATSLTPEGAYWFATHPDLRLVRAAYGARGQIPVAADPAAPEIQALYRDALRDWARDIGHSPAPPFSQ
jgi:hypothetical protein